MKRSRWVRLVPLGWSPALEEAQRGKWEEREKWGLLQVLPRVFQRRFNELLYSKSSSLVPRSSCRVGPRAYISTWGMGSLGEGRVRLVGARDEVAPVSKAMVARPPALGRSRRRCSHERAAWPASLEERYSACPRGDLSAKPLCLLRPRLAPEIIPK